MQCNQKQSSMTSPINSFALFCYNYPHNFIKECWEEGGWIVDHLESKFQSYYEEYGALEAPLRLYLALDNGNKARLEEYIATLDL